MNQNPRFEQFGSRAAAALAALMFMSHVHAQVIVSISAPPAAAGESTTATIVVDQSIGVAGADIAITLPEFVSAAPATSTAATSDFLIASRSQPGRIEISMARAQGLSQQQATILQVPLRIGTIALVGPVGLTFARLQIYDDQPAAIPARALNGTINIVAPSADDDKDGLPDDWERKHFGNVAASAEVDSDGDGVSNHHELIAGTDPIAADSVFRISRFHGVDHTRIALIEWEGREGRDYQIEWSNGPLGPSMAWHKVYNPTVKKEGARLSWIDDGTRTHGGSAFACERYYRVIVVTGQE